MNNTTSNKSSTPVDAPTQELLQDLSDATDTLQDELNETISTIEDVITALKSWNSELNKIIKDLEPDK